MSQGVHQTAVDLRLFKAYKAKKPTNLTPPPTYGNASTKEPLVLPKWHVRAGANDHFQHASRGLGAQIVRAV
jgi:hypothetical protein